jgi:protocatechuate 3,4-dioxygenase beta subunit
MQAGWFQTEPPSPFVYNVTATSGSSQSGLNFGNFQLVDVTGNVYNDLNANGNLDPGDPGLQGWTVNLENQSGNIVATTTSDANGNYEFDNLFPGTFVVAEVLMSGWTQTQPVNPNFYTFTTQSGLNETGLNFGNFKPGVFTGTVYDDLNGDGVHQSNERPLVGWTIDLLNSVGTLVATTTSDAMGHYTFDDLPPGVYTIEEIVQPGWVITEPTNPPGTYTVSAQSGGTITGLDFGNFKAITVSGSIYNDLDGNGLRGSSEPGLSGWTVDLEDTAGNVLASVLTDSNGNYSFTGVGGGSYMVAEVIPTNWVQTQPQFPTNYSFTAQSGLNLSALVFGDHASPALNPTAVIDNGQPGYSETGSWSTALGGFNGTNRISRTARGKGATATAAWNFSGLAAGSYDVYVTFAGKPNYATNAPFSALDSGTTLGRTSLNESILVTQSQGGLAQGSYGGVGWLDIGKFTTTDGNLEVLLTNLSNQNFIDADGVLLVADSGQSVVSPGHASLSAGSPGLAVGTLSESGTTGVQNTNGTTTPTVSLGTVTTPVALSVVYGGTLPAQDNPPSASVVDLAISSLADDDISTKKANA